MQTTKKYPARDISRLESEDHTNKAKDSTHENNTLTKLEENQCIIALLKKKPKQKRNKTKSKPTLKPHFNKLLPCASPPEKEIMEI